jgi:hypothetical protein
VKCLEKLAKLLVVDKPQKVHYMQKYGQCPSTRGTKGIGGDGMEVECTSWWGRGANMAREIG